MKRLLMTVVLSSVWLLAGGVQPAAAQQAEGDVVALTGSYGLVAVTGTMIDDYGPVLSLGRGPSINDNGKVAFMGWDTVKMPSTLQGNRVFLMDNTGTFDVSFVNTDLQIVAPYTQVNDNDQITWQDFTFPDDRTRIRRLDDPLGGLVLGTGSVSDTGEQFQLVVEWPSINDAGSGAFGADLHAGGGTVLALYDEALSSVTTTTPLSGFPNFKPVLSNDNQTVVRGGAPADSPIVVFTDETMANALILADMTEFTTLGNSPGISDDGRVAVFTADEIAAGNAGVYMAVLISPTQFTRFRVTGLGAGTDLHQRVGVNRDGEGTPNDFLVTYHSDDTSGDEGLYAVTVNIDDEFSPVIGSPEMLVQVGGTLSIIGNAVSDTITEIDTYDPVNNNGQAVFWARTSDGTEAVVKVAVTDAASGGLPYGDVNGDTNITSIDASQAARHTVGLITLGAGAQARADVNGSGNISSIDASQIARYAVGLITCFPVEPGCP